MTTALIMDNVGVHFGGVKALVDVNMVIEAGELVGLIGPNGAGKTTVFNIITGAIKPTTGNVILHGESIAGKRPDQVHHMGVSRTFQNIRLFPRMSVYDNVALGIHSRAQYTLTEAFFRTPRVRRIEAQNDAYILDLLGKVGLEQFRAEHAGNLPYGLQRRLEIARAMAASPQLLLLDEPAAGMNEDECADMVSLVRRIHENFQVAIILIEHHMNVVMDLCANSRLYVLNLGQILAVGSPAEIQDNPDVIAAYLGQRRTKTA